MAGSSWSRIAGSDVAIACCSTLYLDSASSAREWVGVDCSVSCRFRVDGAARTRTPDQCSGTATR